MTQRKRHDWWFIAGTVLFAATTVFAFARLESRPTRTAFDSFEPGIGLFPAAPVADAVTSFGSGTAWPWPYSPSSCDMGMGRYDYHVDFGDWQTVRHDWSEENQARSWIVSESVTTFDDFDRYDDYIADYRNAVDYCGWDYERTINDGFNSVLTDLDGLPSGSFAFIIDASPEFGPDYPETFGDSNPDELRALGAVLPGRQRGVVMFVTWIGWNVDVPTDEFVATANALFDAAHEHADAVDTGNSDEPSSVDDTLVDVDSAPFDLADANVLELLHVSPDNYIANHMTDVVRSNECGRRGLGDIADELADRARNSWPETAFKRVDAGIVTENREVWIGTAQWESSSIYSEAVERSKAMAGTPCIDSTQGRVFLIEPVALDGMPTGSVVSKWYGRSTDNEPDETLVAVLADDASHKVMIIEWRDDSGRVLVDDFVAATNQAWQSYLAGGS